MKRVLLLVILLALVAPSFAGDKNKKTAAKAAAKNETVDSTEIKWMSLDDVQVAMKKQPKKVFIDIYTDWCGWCKVMDKKTFRNTDVIKYMNKNFYAVKFNAEQKDSIRFIGKMYGLDEEGRTNALAVELLRGQISYPSSVIMEENFQNPQAVPGYLDVPVFEKIIKYLGENIYKTIKFEEYSTAFKPSWAYDPAPVKQADFQGNH